MIQINAATHGAWSSHPMSDNSAQKLPACREGDPSRTPRLVDQWAEITKAASNWVIAWNERSSERAQQRINRICQRLSDIARRIGIGKSQPRRTLFLRPHLNPGWTFS
jgi:hypothetical protein